MTEIKKSLASDNAMTTATVAATLDFTRQKKLVTLRLEGTILSEHTEALRDFLQNLSYFPGNKWTLELENLAVISMRGLRVLTKFANVIRRRGDVIEIINIRPAMLATFLDMGMHELFGWETVKRQSHVTAVSSPRKLSERTRENRILVEEVMMDE